MSTAVARPTPEAPQRAPTSTPAEARGLHRVVLAIARAAMPAGARLPAPDARLLERLDAFLSAAPRHIARGYRLLVWLFEWSALPFTLRRFSRLPPEAALRHLERWLHSPLFFVRILFRGLVTPIKLGHFAVPEISRLIGYDPPPPAPPDPPPPYFARVFPAEAHAGETVRTTVVVVGTGPGGAVMATRLAERGLDVVLLEEGRYHRRESFNRRPFEMMLRMYREIGLTVALGIPGIPLPLGKTVGGTSTINSGTCFRVPRRVLAHWREAHGLEAFTEEALAPHYAESEAFLKVQPVPREVWGKVPEIIRRGAEKLGWSHGPLMRNADHCRGSGVCCFGCPTDAKRSMNLSYVPRALEASARLYSGARVEEILHWGGRARGVVAATERGPLTVHAEAVVVACGAIYTPLLLMKNRIPDRSGQLGKNLCIHPATKVAALFDEEVRGWEGVPQGYCVDEFKAEGIVFEGASVPPEYGAIGIPQVGRRFTELMEHYDRIAFFGFLVEDERTGSVRPGFGGSPAIRYDVGPAELAKLKRASYLLSQLFFEAGAQRVLPPVTGVEELSDPKELERLLDPKIGVKDFELAAFHPLGTCRLGVRPEAGVLTPTFETWGLENLFVADGSVFPSSLGVNPQMTIMAFASMAAEAVAARIEGTEAV